MSKVQKADARTESERPWQSYPPTGILPAHLNPLRTAREQIAGPDGIKIECRMWFRRQRLDAAELGLAECDRRHNELIAKRRRTEDADERRAINDEIDSILKQRREHAADIEDFKSFLANDAKELALATIEQGVRNHKALYDAFVDHADVDFREINFYQWQLDDDPFCNQLKEKFPGQPSFHAPYANGNAKRSIATEWYRITAKPGALGDESSFALAKFDASRTVVGVGGAGRENAGNVATITSLVEVRRAWWPQEEAAVRKALAARLKLESVIQLTPEANEGRKSADEPLPKRPPTRAEKDEYHRREPEPIGSPEHDAWIAEGLRLYGLNVEGEMFVSAPKALAYDEQNPEIIRQVRRPDAPPRGISRQAQPELPIPDAASLKASLAAIDSAPTISDEELQKLRNPTGSKISAAEAMAIARSEAPQRNRA